VWLFNRKCDGAVDRGVLSYYVACFARVLFAGICAAGVLIFSAIVTSDTVLTKDVMLVKLFTTPRLERLYYWKEVMLVSSLFGMMFTCRKLLAPIIIALLFLIYDVLGDEVIEEFFHATGLFFLHRTRFNNSVAMFYRVSALAQLGTTIENINIVGGGVDLDISRILSDWNKTALLLHPYVIRHVGQMSTHE